MAKPKRSAQELEQLLQTVQMFEVIAETQPNDIQSLEILKEAYLDLGRDADAVGISKKVAQAYVHLGQLSSAILEYEGILQKFPDDAESLSALGELENKMAGLAGRGAPAKEAPKTSAAPAAGESEQFEDGNESLAKFFVENQLFSDKDKGNLLTALAAQISQTPSTRPAPSLINLISERGIASAERCIALICEKTRIPFLPMDCYDIDNSRVTLVDKEFSLKNLVIPFDQLSKTLLVATSNPFDAKTRAHVERLGKGKVQWYVAQPMDLTKLLKDIHNIQ